MLCVHASAPAQVALALLLISCSRHVLTLRTDQQFWLELAQRELEEALQVQWNVGVAKNVVLFVGDGMGPNTVTAARMMQGGETHRLAFETFPHLGLLKTYSANMMVPDSASTATALFCGVKANHGTVGLDASVPRRDCNASLRTEARLKSLAARALEAGKSAGFVTTMRVTHATPSPLYAHSADRGWECDAALPAGARACKDIARQLVEDWPGRDLQVIMGGGRQSLIANVSGSAADPVDVRWGCARADGRDLARAHAEDKRRRGRVPALVHNTRQLRELDVDNTEYLLGLFANSHMEYDHARDQGPDGQPSLAEMTAAAIAVLQKNNHGFFLMVEGGNIDMAHHRGTARRAASEAAALEAAVRSALARTSDRDTLLVVTSDHGHTLAINGYPARGSDVFGLAGAVNYTTLAYGTGGPGSMQYRVVGAGDDARVERRDARLDDTTGFDYEQVAAVSLEENQHGGGDVVIYAKGPQAHLFHSVHEQHYVHHAIAHAARLPPRPSARLPPRPAAAPRPAPVSAAVIVLAALLAFFT